MGVLERGVHPSLALRAGELYLFHPPTIVSTREPSTDFDKETHRC